MNAKAIAAPCLSANDRGRMPSEVLARNWRPPDNTPAATALVSCSVNPLMCPYVCRTPRSAARAAAAV
jgi:hypothetical protein